MNRLAPLSIGLACACLLSSPIGATDYSEMALSYCTDGSSPTYPAKPERLTYILESERGTYAEEEVLEAMAKSAAIDIARASDSKRMCEKEINKGQSRFDKVLLKNEKQLRKKKHKLSQDSDVRNVQAAIIDHWVADQASRSAYIALQTKDRTGADFWAQRLSVAYSRNADRRSREYLKQILTEWDWIDRKRFGASVSDHAWILVQHADAEPDFQKMVLDRMKPFLENGGIRSKHYAYLWDRVAVNTGQLQRFGTQPDWQCENGKMQLRPLEDPQNVNVRRASMGLNTVEEGLAEMERSTCR